RDRGTSKVHELVDISKVDTERTIRGLIVDEIAACRAPTYARRMVNAGLSTQYRVAVAEHVPRETKTRLDVDCSRRSEPARSVWIVSELQAVVWIAAVGNDRADEVCSWTSQHKQLARDRIARASRSGWTRCRRRECNRTSGLVKCNCLRRIEQRRNEVRSLSIDLLEWRVIAKAHTVVKRQPPVQLPLIRCIPLHLRQTQIRERTRCRFLIVSEVADECVRICIPRVAERVGIVAVVACEIEDAGPLPTRCLAVQQSFKVNAKLQCVIAVRDRNIVCKRRLDVIVADLTPAIEPVDVSDAV